MTEWLATAETAAAQFHFLRPLWCLALIPLVVTWWILKYQSGRLKKWQTIIAPELVPLLIGEGGNRTINLRPWVLSLGLIAVVALMGPTWNKRAVPVHKQEQAMVILFDLSPSMLASDLKPDRLTRARLKTIDLLSAYKEGTAALIAYAGDAHVVTPLTDDANTIISQLPVLHPNIMPASGSNPEAALDLAIELITNAGNTEADIVLVTDGITPGARENLHERLQNQPGLRLSILGVGTEEGAPIPLNQYGFARDGQGGIVIAKLNADELQVLAQRNKGVYRTITGTDADIKALLGPLQNRSADQARELERKLDIWQDQGFWLVLVLLPFGLLAFRRGLLSVLPPTLLVGSLLHSPASEAGIWQDLWQTPDQQGMEALKNEDPASAQGLFEDPAWQGVAAAQSGDYAAAAEAFSQLNTADNHYNRGNALARAGDLDGAIEAYEKALELDPDIQDAADNKALVESLKNQQQNQQSQDQNGESSDQNGEQPKDGNNQGADSQSDQDNSSSDSEPGKGQQPDAESQQGNQGESSSDIPSDSASNNSGQEPSAGEEPSAGKKPSANKESSGEKEQSASNASPQDEQPGGENETASNSSAGEQEPDQSEPREADQEGQQAIQGSSLSEEEQQNAEQWLRRVPDNPGGLLRNKFKYQAEQRFRAERNSPKPPPGQYSEERW